MTQHYTNSVNRKKILLEKANATTRLGQKQKKTSLFFLLSLLKIVGQLKQVADW